MANSANKGKRGEREFCHTLHDFGYAARRSEQHNGSVPDGAPDVYTDLDNLIHFEVKRRDRKIYHKALRDWLQKAREETPGGKDTVVAWRPDHSNFWFHLIPVEVDTQHDFKILYGTEALVDAYDPSREYASLQEKDDPHEHRHNVQHTDWL
jgi:Holliday junction resolvase